MPSMSGSLGAESPPVALMSVVQVRSPAEVRTRHSAASSSHAAPSSSTPKWKRSSTPASAATFSAYAWISAWGEYVRLQSGLGANEKL